MFIVFEGGEGAGKSTVSEMVARNLASEGREVVLTREPGGTPAGEEIRRVLHQPLSPWAEAFAFLSARAQLVEMVIRPALHPGGIVLCDRFEASTFAYQGYARGLPMEPLRAANALATGGLTADLTVWLDIEPAAGLARKHGESELIATGGEDLEFHKRVRRGYLAQFEAAKPGTWIRLDATRRPEILASEIVAAIGRNVS